MSFKCQKCGIQQVTGQPQNKIVVESRPKKYTFSYNTEYKEATETSEGWEIIKELAVCPTCYKAVTGNEPQKVQEKVPVKLHENHPREEEPQQFRRHSYRNSERKARQEQRKAPIVEVVNPVRK